MGGDHAPQAVVEGALLASSRGLPVLLVGDPARIEPLLPKGQRLAVRPALEALDERPSVAQVRRRKGSAVRQTLAAVRQGEACAAVSVGHTGAAMASALFELGRLPGVDRPAVTRAVPRADGGQLVILDLGANVDCKPGQLAQFAVMGHCFAAHVLDLEEPRVGLLSNGDEEGKGNELVRAAVPLLADLDLDYIGQVEPTAAFRGACEVLVCDGFVGNIMLKTVEATADVVGRQLKEQIISTPKAQVGAWLMRGAFQRFRSRTDWSRFGGAMLLGVDGVVLVGHGRSDAAAVAATIQHAHHCAQQALAERLSVAIGAALGASHDAVGGP